MMRTSQFFSCKSDVDVPLRQVVVDDFRDVHSPNEFLDYYNRACTAICRTLVFVVAVALGSIVPVAMVVIGSIYMHDCPVEPNIPVYLIVGGLFGILKTALSSVNRIRIKRMIARGESRPELSSIDPIYVADSMISVFLLIWLIIGTFWEFGSAFPNFKDGKSPLYCHPTLYWFTFVLLIVTYVCAIITVLLVCCCCGVFLIISLMNGSEVTVGTSSSQSGQQQQMQQQA